MKAMDLTGMTFGKLTVIGRIENTEKGSAQWLCRCDCGNRKNTTTTYLNSRKNHSCGCGYTYSYTGKRFGMLAVIGRADNVGKKTAWSCRCDCGKEVVVMTGNLSSGASQSCGCVRTKHLGKGTRLYRIWSGMKDRCLNLHSKYWPRYGGRGVGICEEWISDFEPFREWALANGYKRNLTIDRIKNARGYCPDNCQWITREENSSKGASC